MGIFGARAGKTNGPSQQPAIDLATAAPIVYALAKAPSYTSEQLRHAVADWANASNGPLDLAASFSGPEDMAERPWEWLVWVQRTATASGDEHVAAAALWWAGYFTSSVVNAYDYGDLAIFASIPAHLKSEILRLGKAAAANLPEQFRIAGDETGEITPPWLIRAADRMLEVD
jgi:hypothetical protein